MDFKEIILLNGFWLFLIPLLINVFYSKLPMDRFFPKKPSKILKILEMISRILALGCSILLLIQFQENPKFKLGLIIYITGLVIYFGSWIILIIIQEETIANLHPVLRTALLFAPAYTPLIWLIGMALICDALWFAIPASVFVLFHVLQLKFIYVY